MKENLQKNSGTFIHKSSSIRIEKQPLQAVRRSPGKIFYILTLFSVLFFPVNATRARAENAASLTEALTKGKATLNLRSRFEWVDQAGIVKEAKASTLRTRLGYGTARFKGFSGFLEFEDISAVGDEQFNSTVNGKAQYPVVADPEDTELNQIYLQYKGLNGFTLKGGRQRIKIDNDRFIGNVGWRQNEQTFDAVSLTFRTLSEFIGTYVYLANVNRIFGAHHPTPAKANTKMDSHLIHLSHGGHPNLQVSAYGYLLDFEDSPTVSTQTVGIRFKGRAEATAGFKVLYTAEYADQDDYADGAAGNDADYFFGELGGSLKGVTVKVSYEVLGGDGVYGFSTPLATLHAFQGWTDKFLTTPVNGVEDLYFSLSGKVAGIKLMAVYHSFSSDSNHFDYGTETGFLAVKKLSKNYLIGIKYASYNSDNNAKNTGGTAVDTDKLWMTGQVQF